MHIPVLILVLGVEIVFASCPFPGKHQGDTPCPFSSAPPLRPSYDVTAKGCKCKSNCGDDYMVDVGPIGRCDWCRTHDNCGQFGIGGSWDWCVYPGMKDFEAQKHGNKSEQIWARITNASVVDKSGPAPSAAQVLLNVVTISMITAFDDQWEVMPKGRTKVIHAQGVLCKFALVVNSNNSYTGIFESGKQHGLIRMGSAATLDDPLAPSHLYPFPGMGVKFFRTGVRSADFVVLRDSGAGVDKGFNFMGSQFSNHGAPDPALVALHKFQQASGCIDMVGLSDACTYTQNGERVKNPVFPFQIIFVPTGKVEFPDTKKSNKQLLSELASIPEGTELFEVWTFADPKDKAAGRRTKLGTLTTTSTCHQSLFGDEHLFFRHQRMEEDFAAQPDWIDQMKLLKNETMCAATVGPVSKWQCVAPPTPSP